MLVFTTSINNNNSITTMNSTEMSTMVGRMDMTTSHHLIGRDVCTLYNLFLLVVLVKFFHRILLKNVKFRDEEKILINFSVDKNTHSFIGHQNLHIGRGYFETRKDDFFVLDAKKSKLFLYWLS